jgi:hypothetical protein
VTKLSAATDPTTGSASSVDDARGRQQTKSGTSTLPPAENA